MKTTRTLFALAAAAALAFGGAALAQGPRTSGETGMPSTAGTSAATPAVGSTNAAPPAPGTPSAGTPARATPSAATSAPGAADSHAGHAGMTHGQDKAKAAAQPKAKSTKVAMTTAAKKKVAKAKKDHH